MGELPLLMLHPQLLHKERFLLKSLILLWHRLLALRRLLHLLALRRLLHLLALLHHGLLPLGRLLHLLALLRHRLLPLGRLLHLLALFRRAPRRVRG